MRKPCPPRCARPRRRIQHVARGPSTAPVAKTAPGPDGTGWTSPSPQVTRATGRSLHGPSKFLATIGRPSFPLARHILNHRYDSCRTGTPRLVMKVPPRPRRSLESENPRERWRVFHGVGRGGHAVPERIRPSMAPRRPVRRRIMVPGFRIGDNWRPGIQPSTQCGRAVGGRLAGFAGTRRDGMVRTAGWIRPGEDFPI
jgi:hypothetical protein